MATVAQGSAAWARDPIMADRTAAPKMMAISPALCQKCDVCMTCSLSHHRLRLSRPGPIGGNPETRRSDFERLEAEKCPGSRRNGRSNDAPRTPLAIMIALATVTP